eukprot:TRINITY_DN59408_c0_g1_i1.p1 TRINITY_DN59408_c0_g1~~TRINITY_DN59408_c0_g1_i1.p1  ORF type:complete len:128 (+),score=13.66 TRINITY_DN59408_c0_g1_i1:122-505(+)
MYKLYHNPQKQEKMYGFPLELFGKQSSLFPLFTLGDLDALKESGFVIGTTNPLVLQLSQTQADVIVNVDEKTVKIEKSSLSSSLLPMPEEEIWIKQIVEKLKLKTKNGKFFSNCFRYLQWRRVRSGI